MDWFLSQWVTADHYRITDSLSLSLSFSLSHTHTQTHAHAHTHMHTHKHKQTHCMPPSGWYKNVIDGLIPYTLTWLLITAGSLTLNVRCRVLGLSSRHNLEPASKLKLLIKIQPTRIKSLCKGSHRLALGLMSSFTNKKFNTFSWNKSERCLPFVLYHSTSRLVSKIIISINMNQYFLVGEISSLSHIEIPIYVCR